jgi:hypothetical protein
MLHTINGFLCAAIGFSMIDILNNSEKFHKQLKPFFVGVVAFCFSMTIGVLWEFFEFGMDYVLKTDMQKDRIVTSISSVEINPENSNEPIIIKNINKTVISYIDKDGNLQEYTVNGGYLDLGIIDTMKDLIVNFIGALIFSFIGYLYIKDRDEYKFAEKFIPRRKLNNHND